MMTGSTTYIHTYIPLYSLVCSTYSYLESRHEALAAFRFPLF